MDNLYSSRNIRQCAQLEIIPEGDDVYNQKRRFYRAMNDPEQFYVYKKAHQSMQLKRPRDFIYKELLSVPKDDNLNFDQGADLSIPRCLRVSSNLAKESVSAIRERLKRNQFMHKRWDQALAILPQQKLLKNVNKDYKDMKPRQLNQNISQFLTESGDFRNQKVIDFEYFEKEPKVLKKIDTVQTEKVESSKKLMQRVVKKQEENQDSTFQSMVQKAETMDFVEQQIGVKGSNKGKSQLNQLLKSQSKSIFSPEFLQEHQGLSEVINQVRDETERSMKKVASKQSNGVTTSPSYISIKNFRRPLNQHRDRERLNSSPPIAVKMFNCDVSSVVSGIETDDREYRTKKDLFISDSMMSLTPSQSVTCKHETFRQRLNKKNELNSSASSVLVRSIMKSCEQIDEKNQSRVILKKLAETQDAAHEDFRNLKQNYEHFTDQFVRDRVEEEFEIKYRKPRKFFQFQELVTLQQKTDNFEDEHFTSRQMVAKSKNMDKSIARMLIAESRSVYNKPLWRPEQLNMKKELLRSIERDQIIMGQTKDSQPKSTIKKLH